MGATGYIGKFVVKELVKRGYNVIAFAREKSGVGGKASMEDTKQVRICTAQPATQSRFLKFFLMCGRMNGGRSGHCRSWTQVSMLLAKHRDHVCFLQDFQGADVCFGSVADLASLSTVAFAEPVDVVVSCLASRTGGKVHRLHHLSCLA